MNRVTINGKTYIGSNISSYNNQVVVVGVLIDDGTSGRIIEIKVTGTIQRLDCEASVSCASVTGNVSAGGSVNCGDVSGSVTAGGSVRSGKIGGSVIAGGSIGR